MVSLLLPLLNESAESNAYIHIGAIMSLNMFYFLSADSTAGTAVQTKLEEVWRPTSRSIQCTPSQNGRQHLL